MCPRRWYLIPIHVYLIRANESDAARHPLWAVLPIALLIARESSHRRVTNISHVILYRSSLDAQHGCNEPMRLFYHVYSDEHSLTRYLMRL